MTESRIIRSQLYRRVLLNPAEQGGDRLYVVAGFATPAMASVHLAILRAGGLRPELNLLVGMTPSCGISKINHAGFRQLVRVDSWGQLRCSYMNKKPAVHAKLYAWFKKDKPLCAFIGSANYTQTGFGEQREALAEIDAVEVLDYYTELHKQAIPCEAASTDAIVKRYRPEAWGLGVGRGTGARATGATVKTSLLTRRGDTGSRSGLNWGQRSDREPNQAYIRLDRDVYMSRFFPPRGVRFTVLTDDGYVFICTRAQDNGKAIETPENNSLLGLYFRHRIGVQSGLKVRRADLERYGRTDVTFKKGDGESYRMDFSV